MKLTVKDVSKKYRQKMAVNNISFTIETPKIYALLGRNGAGKTTLMDMIANHILPTSGEIKMDGRTLFDNREKLQHICLIKEANNFHPDMRVKDVLKTYKSVYPKWNDDLAMSFIQIYRLPMKSRIKTLSKGMASSLGVIVGLASGAEITIFDEPYIGMDAAARKKFYDQLLDVYERENRTIIISTHLIDEASLLFEEIFIMKDGEIILRESVDIIRDQTYTVTGDKSEVLSYIEEKEVMHTKELGHLMTAHIYGEKDEIPDTLKVEGIPIQDVMIYLTELEEERV